MASKFKTGDTARQVVKPIEGTVSEFGMDKETGDRLVLIEWAEPGDEADEIEVKSRWFREDELEKAE
jgi:hypothetical protein